MKDFTTISAPEPSERDWKDASDAVRTLQQGGQPKDRMEAGLLLAMSLGIDPRHERVVEERRFEMAYAHALARNARDGAEAPMLASHDWGRSFLVDASLQREAEVSLQSKPKEAASRHRWGAAEVIDEVWSQAGVPPTMFLNASEEEMKSIASGRMYELNGNTAAQVEISVMAAMTEGSPRLEHSILAMAAYAPPGSDLPKGRALVELVDREEFGPQNAGPDHHDMGAMSDRIILARRAAEVGHRDARGLFDPTPGRSPFATTFEDEKRAERAVMGLDRTAFGRTVTIATNTIAALDGWNQDPEGPHRIKMAAARLLSTGPSPLGDERADVRSLMADVYLQRSAEDRLTGRDTGATRMLETIVSGNADSRESVRFTTLDSERAETQAVADGRFDMVGDSRGIASGLRNATWRAGIVGAADIDRAIRQEIDALRAPKRIVSVAKGPRREESPAVAMAIAARGGAGR